MLKLGDLIFIRRSQIVVIAQQLYSSAPMKARILQRLRPFICPFDELLKWIPANANVLDVGCGAGLFLGLIASSRPTSGGVGFDTDDVAVGAASAMARQHFPDGRIRFEHSAIGDPWPDGIFDVVSMVDVLHHVPPSAQNAVIRDAYAHVAFGGLFIYKDMADKPFVRAWWNRLHDLIIAREWIHYRQIGEVEIWLREMGAEIVERSFKNLGPYGHELIVAKKRT